MSKWKYFEKKFLVYQYCTNKPWWHTTPCVSHHSTAEKIWWGGINIENCHSYKNKNCQMAIYRAYKNKKYMHSRLRKHA